MRRSKKVWHDYGIIRQGSCLVLSAYCLVLTGCVYRSLTIRTDPPGAKVYVNDVLKGESPVTYDFEWYGWHRLTIRKEGFQRLDDRTMLRAPLYLWIPVDLAMELLPFPIRDRRTWSYTLTPATEPPTPAPPATTVEPSEPPRPGDDESRAGEPATESTDEPR